jgi:integrase
VSKPKKVPNIDERPNGEYRVRVKGFAPRQFSVLADAITYRDTLKRARQTGTMKDPNADLIKLHELAAEHFAAEGGHLAPRTRQNYNAAWSHVRSHPIRDMPLRMITPRVVEDFRDDVAAKYPAGKGGQAVLKALTVLSAVMARGERHYGHANPVLKVKKPPQGRQGFIRVMAPDAVERLRAKLTGTDAVLVSVLAYTGMRPEEARALTWSDVQARTIKVDKAAEPDGTIKATKNRRNRTTRLLEPLRDDLTAFRVASGSPPDGALIFPRADGGAWREHDYKNWAKRTFAKAARDAELGDVTPYALRHSAGSLWLHDGTPAVHVAKWLGHSLKTLSDNYAHVIDDLDPDDRRSAVDMIMEARQDNHRTTLRVLASPDESKPVTRKPRARKRAAG